MNVSFFYQHYWPDSPPYAAMLKSIAEHLSDEGSSVHILTGQPSYKSSDRLNKSHLNETLDGVEVQRLRSLPGNKHNLVRLFQKVLFPLRGFMSLLIRRYIHREKIDVVIAATIPPVINGFFALLASRLIGAKFIYHLQDIYPEIGVPAGLWKNNSFRYRILRTFDNWVCKAADCCVVLSDDMRQSLVNRGIPLSSIEIINNFLLESHDHDELNEFDPSSLLIDKDSVIFAGNLGRFQGLEAVLSGYLIWLEGALRDTGGASMHLHFLGDGAAKQSLMSQAVNSTHVHFHDHLPYSDAKKAIELSGAGIVSLEPDIYRFAYPSKTLTYLGLGTPILAIVESDSALAEELDKNNLGLTAKSREPKDIAMAFNKLNNKLQNGDFEVDELHSYYSLKYSTEVAFTSWSNILNQLTEPAKRLGRKT